MSKVLRGLGRIAGSALGFASLIPGPQQPFVSAAAIGLGLLGSIGGAGKGSKQFEQLQQIAELLKRPPPLSQTVRGGTSPRILAFGRVASSGVSIARENTPNQVQYLEALYLQEGPIDGLDALICDDEFVPLTNNYLGASYEFFWPTTGRKQYPGGLGPLSAYIQIDIASGTAQGKCSPLFSAEADYGSAFYAVDPAWKPFWDRTHLGKGCTILYTVARSTTNPADRLIIYPNGFPAYSAIWRAATVYDPRDPGQRFSQDSFDIYNPDQSWKWSENPALCAAYYVSYLISQNLTAMTGVDWESIGAAANDCDALSPKRRNGFNGGKISSEPFARISASIELDMEPRDVLAKFMESCDGEWGVDQYGRFTMWVRKWEEPAIVFTGADISDFVEEFGPSSNDEINYVHSTYVEPRQNFQRVETAIFRDEKSAGEIGRRTGAYPYEWVQSPDQAYRLTARRVKRSNGRRRISCALGPRALTALKQRVVGFDAPEFGLVGTFRVEDLRPADASLVNWQGEFVEIAEDAYVDAVLPEDPIYGLALVNQPSIATPTYLLPSARRTGSAVGVAQLSLDIKNNIPDQSGPTGNIPTGNTLNQDPTLQLDGRYSTDGGTNWLNFDVLISAMIMQTPELPRESVVTMQARFVASNGAAGSYSSSVTATIP